MPAAGCACCAPSGWSHSPALPWSPAAAPAACSCTSTTAVRRLGWGPAEGRHADLDNVPERVESLLVAIPCTCWHLHTCQWVINLMTGEWPSHSQCLFDKRSCEIARTGHVRWQQLFFRLHVQDFGCKSRIAQTNQASQDSVWVYFLAGKRHDAKVPLCKRFSPERRRVQRPAALLTQLSASTNQDS